MTKYIIAFNTCILTAGLFILFHLFLLTSIYNNCICFDIFNDIHNVFKKIHIIHIFKYFIEKSLKIHERLISIMKTFATFSFGNFLVLLNPLKIRSLTGKNSWFIDQDIREVTNFLFRINFHIKNIQLKLLLVLIFFQEQFKNYLLFFNSYI